MEETVKPEHAINPENEGLDDVKSSHSSKNKPIERSSLGGWRKLKTFLIAVREGMVKIVKNDATKTSNDAAEEDEFMEVWSKLNRFRIPSKLYTEDSPSSLSSFNKWLQYTPRSLRSSSQSSQSPGNTQLSRKSAPPGGMVSRSRKSAPLNGMVSRITTTVQPRRFNLHSEEKLFPPRNPCENTLRFYHNPPKTTLT